MAESQEHKKIKRILEEGFKRDGGWYSFTTKDDALNDWKRYYDGLNWDPCKICNP